MKPTGLRHRRKPWLRPVVVSSRPGPIRLRGSVVYDQPSYRPSCHKVLLDNFVYVIGGDVSVENATGVYEYAGSERAWAKTTRAR